MGRLLLYGSADMVPDSARLFVGRGGLGLCRARCLPHPHPFTLPCPEPALHSMTVVPHGWLHTVYPPAFRPVFPTPVVSPPHRLLLQVVEPVRAGRTPTERCVTSATLPRSVPAVGLAGYLPWCGPRRWVPWRLIWPHLPPPAVAGFPTASLD